MTDPFSQPYVFPGAERPERPRPLFGKVVGWSALVLGLVILLGSLADFSITGMVLGLCAAAAGILYLFGKPSRGRLVWATPALATLPALIAFGLTTPTPDPASAPAAFAAPSIAEVSPTTVRSTTTTMTPTTTTPTTTTGPPTTSAAPVETDAAVPTAVTVYAPPPTTTLPYVPAPVPVFIAEPEQAYVPPAAVVPVIPEAPLSVFYDNCSAVRSAGAAPLYAGEPGYSSKLDRDGDGVACEN
ncbi:MAG: excalibur calcium-binding domain-containing protein [Rhodococcus sp. (in: high G+C Gram-positive bacteria)]